MRLSLLLVGVLLAAGACTGDDDGGPTPEPFEYGAEPGWSSERLGFERVKDAVFDDGVLFAVGDRGAGNARLVAVDPATGAVRWSVDHGDPLLGGGGIEAYGEPGFYGAGGRIVMTGGPDPAVLIPYHIVGVRQDTKYSYEAERGVVALSAKDGRVRWKAPTFQASPTAATEAGREPRTSVVAADASVAVVTTVPGTNKTSVDEAKTTAYAVADGRKLWEQSGWWPYLVAGGMVLGERDTRNGQPPWQQESGGGRKGTVVAIDAATGAQRWDLSARFASSELKLAVRGVAVVRTEDDQRKVRTFVLDAATGRVVGDLGDYTVCGTDGDSSVACLDVGDSILRTFRISDGRTQGSSKGVFTDDSSANSVDGVWRGRVFVSGVPSGGKAESVVVDGAGRRSGGKLPGALAAISEKYVAFYRPGGNSLGAPGFAVHRMGASAPQEEQPPPVPVTFSERPLWSIAAGAPGAALKELHGVQLAGDIALTFGEDREEGGYRLVVADAATGRVRWFVRSDARLGGDGTTVRLYSSPDVVQVGGDQLVLLTYQRMIGSRRVEDGLAALSAKDGGLRWKVPIHTGERYQVHVTARAADDRIALLEIWRTGRTKGASSDVVESRTVAVDLRAHRKLWEVPGITPWSVVGGTVLGVAPKLPYELGYRAAGAAVALDAATGKRRWDLAKRHRTARFVATAGSVAVVAAEDGAAVVDIATGRELARLGKDLSRCRDDGEALIVCGTGDESRTSYLVTIRLAAGGPHITQLLNTEGMTPQGILRQWIFAFRGDRTVVLDGNGNPRDGDLPGQLAAVSDRFAVFATEDGSGDVTGYSTYRVLSR